MSDLILWCFEIFYSNPFFGILLVEKKKIILPMGDWFKISDLIMKTYV
jgi:hypothetical protein